MWKNKKDSSSMITILAVTLILVFLSGIILKFIIGTMKSNIKQKDREDLQFAAERGIELARSYFEKDNNSINTKNGGVDESLANELEKDKITLQVK
ncbi:hypothetical protein ACED96_04520 [Clostridium thermobutyricum]